MVDLIVNQLLHWIVLFQHQEKVDDIKILIDSQSNKRSEQWQQTDMQIYSLVKACHSCVLVPIKSMETHDETCPSISLVP